MPRWKTFSMSTTFSRKESAALFSFWLEILTDLWKTWQHLGENLKSIGIFRGCLGKPVSGGLEVLRFQRFWRVKALVGVTSSQQQFWEGFGRWVWSGPKNLQLVKRHTVALDEVTQMENFSLKFTGPTG